MGLCIVVLATVCAGLFGGADTIEAAVEKIGPGQASGSPVSSGPMHYTIFFTHRPKAEAPLRDLEIVDFLQFELNPLSYKLIQIGINGQTLSGEETFFPRFVIGAVDVDGVPGTDVTVEILVDFDPFISKATWTFETLSEDPNAGFLAPGNTGFVKFEVSTIDDIREGTTVSNQAQLTFDSLPPVATNTWRNSVRIDPVFFRRGDVDGNGAVEITDPLQDLCFQFLGRNDCLPRCLLAHDVDDDGSIGLNDSISSLSFQFLGNFTVPPPGAMNCGTDPTDDNLTCDVPHQCDL